MTAIESLALRHRSDLLLIIPIINFFSIALLVIFVAFYFVPAQIVLATRASVIAAGASFMPALLSNRQSVWNMKIIYFRIVNAHTSVLFLSSMIVFLALVTWAVMMFDEIRRRYEYVDAINSAISLVDADQISVPDAKKLAEAFSLKPYRPEVPFIIARAVRILSPDDKLEPFHRYMQTFNNAVSIKDILDRARQNDRQRHIALDDARPIPVVDPISTLAQYMVEVPEVDQKKQYEQAIEMLANALIERPGDTGLAVDRIILDGVKDIDLSAEPVKSRGILLKKYIEELTLAIDQSLSRSNDDDRRFLLSSSYQEALDALASWHLEAALLETSPSSEQANNNIEMARHLFSRLMMLRRRLMVSDDIVWWRAPAKLSIFHYFAEQSGYPSSVAEDLKARSAMTRPTVWRMLEELYAANGFKIFQDPEQWANGTPLAISFNGAATASQLRKWLKQGW